MCVPLSRVRTAPPVGPMVQKSTDRHGTPLVSVDAKEEPLRAYRRRRAKTAALLADPASSSEDFSGRAHVSRARRGGVLKRAGHTEAVDLAVSGLPGRGHMRIMNEDGTMARLRNSWSSWKTRHEDHVHRGPHRLPGARECFVEQVAGGPADGHGHSRPVRTATLWTTTRTTHIALVKGDVAGRERPRQVHSGVPDGRVFGPARCDYGPQLCEAMRIVERKGRGWCSTCGRRRHRDCDKLKAYEPRRRDSTP